MLKYLYYKVVFAEIPGEISLGISISGCKIHCKGCHSTDLWEDKGTPLTIDEIDSLLEHNPGITCILFLGGEHDVPYLSKIAKYTHQKIKTAWYCGLDSIPDNTDIMNYMDWIKVGPWDYTKGGLDSETTNQRMYRIYHYKDRNEQTDITSSFWKKNGF